MKICPKCGKVLSYNSYFGAYICSSCNWEEVSRNADDSKQKVKANVRYSHYKMKRIIKV